MTTFLVALTVGMALVVPSAAFSQPIAAPPAEPSLRAFLPELADDVRCLPSIQSTTSLAVLPASNAGLQVRHVRR